METLRVPQEDTIARHMTAWTIRLGFTREALFHSARTAVAAVLSLMLAHVLKLPEFYWAPISTIVILLSPSDPFTLAWQRFAGTALGATAGAVIATFTVTPVLADCSVTGSVAATVWVWPR